MEQSAIALWVPQVQGRIHQEPEYGRAELTHEQRATVSLATLSEFEYHVERLARANPDIEIKIFDDVQNKKLVIMWRRSHADHR